MDMATMVTTATTAPMGTMVTTDMVVAFLVDFSTSASGIPDLVVTMGYLVVAIWDMVMAVGDMVMDIGDMGTTGSMDTMDTMGTMDTMDTMDTIILDVRSVGADTGEDTGTCSATRRGRNIMGKSEYCSSKYFIHNRK